MLCLTISLILFVLWLTKKWKMRRIVEFSKKIKCGLKSYPLVGHAYLVMGNGEDRMNGLITIGRQALLNGGMFLTWLGLNLYVTIADPVDLKVIMKSNQSKGDEMKILRTVTGNGSIFAPIQIWRPRRKVLVPIFKAKNLAEFVQVFSRQSAIAVEQMSPYVGKGVISFGKYITRYTLDAICETTMNLQINSQRMPNVPFLEAFLKIVDMVAVRILLPWLHFDAIYKLLPSYQEFLKQRSILNSFVNEAIKSCQQTMREDEGKPKEGFKNIVQLIIESFGSNGKSFSDLELHEEAFVLVSAGTDTSGVAACFVLSLLARHPDVQEKVVKELREVFGESDRLVIADDLPHLKYLEVVIKEALRLYPPVPIITRKIEKDVELPSGITLIKDCTVIVHIWAVNRNQKYWGNYAEEFRPERFIEAPLKEPAAFMSFSYGPRDCIGSQYAMMSMKSIVSTILRSYRLLSVYNEGNDDTYINHDPMRVSFEIMMRDVDGFKVKLEKRNLYEM